MVAAVQAVALFENQGRPTPSADNQGFMLRSLLV
jgi:hypothetical protein